MYAPLLILASAILAHAGIEQKDFSGIGHIYVLQSEDWHSATPNSTVGCLDDQGKIVSHTAGSHDCGVFSRREDDPWTLSTKQGNCTFEDSTQERNTDSRYGKNDFAWNCKKSYQSDIYDELYTINGFPYVFLCFGDVDCYYDAKKVPKDDEVLSLWQYRWGSEQTGITPGHVQMQLLWEKIGNLSTRVDKAPIPGPRLRINDGVQVPLQGSRARN